MSKGHEPIALGVVGLGKIARDQHLPTIAQSRDFRLVATASPGERIDSAPGFDSLDAMLAARPEIAAVALCTPPAARVDLARRALEAGCHVMLEKPPTPDLASARALAQCAAASDRVLFASWHSRENACVDRARAWLQDRAVRRITIDWREDIRRWHPGQDWILGRDGFGVFDPGINALSILTALVEGEIACGHARLAIPENRAAPIAATVDLELPGGAPVNVALDFLNTGDQVWDIAIEADEARLRLRQGGRALWIDGHLAETCPDEEYPRLYARFADLIRNGQSDIDLRPLQLAACAIAQGEITQAPPFAF